MPDHPTCKRMKQSTINPIDRSTNIALTIRFSASPVKELTTVETKRSFLLSGETRILQYQQRQTIALLAITHERGKERKTSWQRGLLMSESLISYQT